MQQPKTAQNIRRIAMAIGFTFFLLFVYKASHEVSSSKIAAGRQNIHPISQSDKTSKALNDHSAGYTSPMVIVQINEMPNNIINAPSPGVQKSDLPTAHESAKKDSKANVNITVAKQSKEVEANKSVVKQRQ